MHADTNYYSVLGDAYDEEDSDNEEENVVISEILNVRAGIGGGFHHSSKLKVLNYRQAMKSKDKKKWKQEIKKENNQMIKYKVWEAVPKEEVPNAQPLTSTWAFKKKSNGNLRGRLNAHRFKQKERVHFKKNNISSPMTNEIMIRIVLVLIIILQLLAGVLDVKGAFLQGEFDEDEEQIYMTVLDGMEEYYGSRVLLKLLAPIYSLRNASMVFYKKLKRCMGEIGYRRSLADLCLYFA